MQLKKTRTSRTGQALTIQSREHRAGSTRQSGELDAHDERAGSGRLVSKAKSSTSKRGVELRARGHEASFALDQKDPLSILATGHRALAQFDGGTSSFGGATVRISGLGDGRVVLENVKTDEGKEEDVVMTSDGHGGFSASTSGGTWSLSPANKQAMRELVFSPNDREAPYVEHQLGHPRPLIDLAAFDGAKIVLRPADTIDGSTPPGPKTRQITLDVSGEALGVKLPDGSVKRLSKQLSYGAFADAGDFEGQTVNVLYDPIKASYRISVYLPEGTYVGEIALTKAAQKGAREYRVSQITDGEITPHRASLTSLPGGTLMLRFQDTDLWRPTVIYFNEKTGRGKTEDGRPVSITKPSRDGERTVLLSQPGRLASMIKLSPFDPSKEVAALANKTAEIKIYAPKERAPNGDPLPGQVEKTFTLRFGAKLPGSNHLPVTIDGITWPTDLVLHPTGKGDFTINLSNSRLWLHPKGDGSYEAIAQWSFRAPLTKGSFAITV